MASTRGPATYDDILAAPDTSVAEVVEGWLSTSPRPAYRHANAASELLSDLHAAFQKGRGGPGGWRFLIEPELHLGADVVVPDLAGWRVERFPSLDVAFSEIAPDWLCEVLSPSTTRLDRVRKMPLYAREGVRHAWLLDPTARTLEIYRQEEGKWLLVAAHGDDEIVRAEPFEALELDLLALWGVERSPAAGE